MSPQRNPKLIDMDFNDPSAERRESPIINLPGTAAVGDSGPTGEVRTLIDQLQQTACEARNRLRAVEDERDALARQLDALQRQNQDLRARAADAGALAQEVDSLRRDSETTQRQIDSLQRQNQELRGRVNEAAVAVQERDSAIRDVRANARALEEAQTRAATSDRRLQEVRRQHDEVSRQRDELVRSIDALNKAALETKQSVQTTQAQILSIRQARDTAQSQNRELMEKLARHDDEIADLKYELEHAQANQGEAPNLQPELAALRQELDDALGKLLAANVELEEARRQNSELPAQTHGAAGDAESQTNALMEAQKQMAEFLTARDAACSELAVLQAEIEQLRQRAAGGQGDAEEQARKEVELLKQQHDASEVQINILTKEVLDLRRQIEAQTAQISIAEQSREQTHAQTGEILAQFDSLKAEKEAAERARDEALTSLSSAQKQIDRIIQDRDQVREQATENALALEVQIEALTSKTEELKGSNAAKSAQSNLQNEIEALRAEKEQLALHLDAQRVETIDIATQLRDAHEQIKNLSATLAEARLQTKAATASSRKDSAKGGAAKASAQAAEAVPDPSVTDVTTPAAAVAPSSEPFSNPATVSAVRAMRRCYNAFVKAPDDLSHLNELHCQIHSFAEYAMERGFVAVHRLGAAFDSLVQELYHFPEQISPATLTTVMQSIEFFSTLLKLKDVGQLKDPANAVVCAVDDDSASCECIIMAMESAMLQTIAFRDPTEALCHLADAHCDFFILDIGMAGMDGYELCAEIRQRTRHKDTPVLFVTGQSGEDAREHSEMSGGNGFIEKPFLLCELTLKTLTMMAKAQLHLA